MCEACALIWVDWAWWCHQSLGDAVIQMADRGWPCRRTLSHLTVMQGESGKGCFAVKTAEYPNNIHMDFLQASCSSATDTVQRKHSWVLTWTTDLICMKCWSCSSRDRALKRIQSHATSSITVCCRFRSLVCAVTITVSYVSIRAIFDISTHGFLLFLDFSVHIVFLWTVEPFRALQQSLVKLCVTNCNE